MTKDKRKNLSDFIPLLALTVSAFILVGNIAETYTSFLWNHIAGLIILPSIYLVFWWRHKTGVVTLGFAIILGVLGVISYSYSLVTVGYFVRVSNTELRFICQPIFLLWLAIHLIVSNRHYRGVWTKQYWFDLFGSAGSLQNRA